MTLAVLICVSSLGYIHSSGDDRSVVVVAAQHAGDEVRVCFEYILRDVGVAVTADPLAVDRHPQYPALPTLGLELNRK